MNSTYRKAVLFAVVSFMGLVIFLPASPALASDTLTSKRTEVMNIAHRGASGQAPENTIAAFDRSIAYDADFFELDVQMTKDGKLVLIHDTTVDRTTNGTGAVKDLTFDEIRALDAGSWFDASFAGEKVPTLEEALDRYQDKIGILIELKDPHLYPGIEQKVADALIERNLHQAENIIVQSFNWDVVQSFHDILPAVPTGVLVSSGQTIDGEITNEQLMSFSAYADFVNPNKSLLNQDTVNRIHEHELKTWPYTIKDRKWVERLMGWGVDGIITDYPIFVNTTASANSMKTLVERFEGKELTRDDAQDIKLHLSAISHYEQHDKGEKVVKHLNSLLALLDYQLDHHLLSKRAYDILQGEVHYLLEKW